MKHLRTVFIIPLFALSFAGCATMTEQTVHQTPSVAPKESPSLAASAATKSLKRKVAIGRFTNETKYGQSFFIDENNDKIGKQAMDILSAKLFATGKFLMLERADIASIEKELKIAGEAKKLSVAADYLILGAITEFGRKNVSDVGIFSRVKKQEAFAKVHIRIVDVSTGKIIYSEEGRGTAYSAAGTVFGVGSKAGYDSSLNDQVIEAAITDLTSNIIENMLDKPWRAYILAEQDGRLVISGGASQNIQKGDTFAVLLRGKKVKNPQTGMMIELPGQKLASLTVVSVSGDTPEDEISLCEVTEGNLNNYIASGNFQNLYIQTQE